MTHAALSRPWPLQTPTVEVAKSGLALIRDPLLNKGTAFPLEEREIFRLHGLLPSYQFSMETQQRRVEASLARAPTPFAKYLELTALQDRNETLYYRVLCDHLDELMPVVYTPTVAEATRNFSSVFRRARGVWLTPAFRGRIARVLRDAVGERPIRLIVATDNESILGIGDQGAGGMAICVGKLALYTVAAGIPPSVTLPVSLDVGTDNEALLGDEMYVGWRAPRLRGAEYDEFIDEFVDAVREVFPGALLQWEDLRKDIALCVLERHRERLLSFNDDIQGTGAVAVAGVLAACGLTGVPLGQQRIVVHGAGAAGLGIARQLRAALRSAGLAESAVTERVAALDSRGLLVDDRPQRDAYKRELAWPAALAARLGLGPDADRGLEAVVRAMHPTVLIGTSGQARCFDERVVRAMGEGCARPVILPFSNPTDQSEADPVDLLQWTAGRALVATGSPFPPVRVGERSVRIAQGNNVLIFPGVGLGALLAGARHVTDEMFTAAALCLPDLLTPGELESGMLFPAVNRLRDVSCSVAAAVICAARGEDARGPSSSGLLEEVRAAMWEPRYLRYRPAGPAAAERGA